MKKIKNIAVVIAALVMSIGIVPASAFALSFENTNDYLTNADISSDTPVTSDELETLIKTKNVIWENFIGKNGYAEEAAYAMLKWNSHTVRLLVKTKDAYKKAVAFADSGAVDKNLVEVVLSPKYDYRICDGGANADDEVNDIIADEYLAIKDFLADKKIPSNMYITSETDSKNTDIKYTFIEVYVKDQVSKYILKSYMKENYFWQDVVKISIVSDLAGEPENTVYLKDHVASVVDPKLNCLCFD